MEGSGIAGGDIGADDESGLVALLRKGDAVAFRALVERNHASMLRVAGTFVSDRSTAEEVVQEKIGRASCRERM